MRLIWSGPARADLQSIFDFISQDNSYAAALVVRRIRDRVRQLERTPHIGRIGRVAATRELIISRTPYIVAYRVDELQVSIIRVIHGRREWPLNF